MVDLGKKNVLGVMVSANDYEAAVFEILAAAESRRGFSVSALAIHGVMTTVMDAGHRYRLNHFDMVTADGQGVRWALGLLHGARLEDRVYGPKLMWQLCEECARRDIPIFLYGGGEGMLQALVANLKGRIPGLRVAGSEASKFRRTTMVERQAIAGRIRESGAGVVFVGLGCPRQEVFAYEYRDLVQMPILAVGAAFNYHAGELNEPPAWAQRIGFHGFYRAFQEPRRLWRRFLVLPFGFVALLGLQWAGLWRPRPERCHPPAKDLLYG